MKKLGILFLLCTPLFLSGGKLNAKTVSIAGKRTSAQTNAPRITIGSYIKSRGLTSVKSGSGDSQPVPSSTSTDSDIEEINSNISGIETRVDNIESQTDSMASQMSSITDTITNTIYNKNDIDDLLLGKQDNLPSGGVTGQILTQGAAGLEWTSPEATVDAYTKSEVDDRFNIVDQTKQNNLPSGAVMGQVLTQGATGLEWTTPEAMTDVYTKIEVDDRFNVVDQTKQDNLPTGAENGQVLSYDSGGLEWKTLSSPPGTLPVVSEPGLYIISVWR